MVYGIGFPELLVVYLVAALVLVGDSRGDR